MRESEIRISQEISRRREDLLYRQFEFLETRSRAFETVVLTTPWYMRLLWVFMPGGLLFWPGLKEVVDGVQHNLLLRGEAERRPPVIAKPNAAQVVAARG